MKSSTSVGKKTEQSCVERRNKNISGLLVNLSILLRHCPRYDCHGKRARLKHSFLFEYFPLENIAHAFWNHFQRRRDQNRREIRENHVARTNRGHELRRNQTIFL